jgi:hypothetical protein
MFLVKIKEQSNQINKAIVGDKKDIAELKRTNNKIDSRNRFTLPFWIKLKYVKHIKNQLHHLSPL